MIYITQYISIYFFRGDLMKPHFPRQKEMFCNTIGELLWKAMKFFVFDNFELFSCWTFPQKGVSKIPNQVSSINFSIYCIYFFEG